MPCSKCLEARKKLLEARSAQQAAKVLAEAARINAGKIKGIVLKEKAADG